VCEDVRHSPPETGYHFLTPEQAQREVRTVWQQVGLDLLLFRNEPAIGINPCGYLLLHPEGNIAFESVPWYDELVLAQITALGGVRWWAASHPHTYGGAWQLQQQFNPEMCVQRDDLSWTSSFSVTWPFDDELELVPGVRLLHTGGHFAGHSVLYHEERRALFAGDLLKLHFQDGEVRGLSCHKGFNRRIPLTPAEINRYRRVLTPLDIREVFTSFDHGPQLDRADVLYMLNIRLTSRPSTEPLPLRARSVGR
jgi:hypothetical protein